MNFKAILYNFVNFEFNVTQSAGVVEYSDCTSVE